MPVVEVTIKLIIYHTVIYLALDNGEKDTEEM